MSAVSYTIDRLKQLMYLDPDAFSTPSNFL